MKKKFDGHCICCKKKSGEVTYCGHYFIVRIDQKALKYLLEQRIIDEDQHK